jgi:hypothetical protein
MPEMGLEIGIASALAVSLYQIIESDSVLDDRAIREAGLVSLR